MITFGTLAAFLKFSNDQELQVIEITIPLSRMSISKYQFMYVKCSLYTLNSCLLSGFLIFYFWHMGRFCLDVSFQLV